MSIKTSVIKSFRGALDAVEIYPLVIIGGAIFTLTSMVRIQMDIEEDTLRFLFDCIQMSFACMIAYSLFSTALIKKLNKSIYWSHVSSVLVLLIAFLALFVFSRPTTDAYRGLRVTDIATARVFIWIGICLIAYIVVIGQKIFSQSFYVFLKALAIAFIYGSVLMGGSTGVAGAVQGLLYSDMSEKVYMHLSAIVLFVTFTLFIGLLPSLDYKLSFEKRPNFIRILFHNIMIPIIGALTLVLLLWIGKALLGDWPNFRTVMGIVISYVVVGVFVYLMVICSQEKICQLFKTGFPFISLLILVFGLYAFTRHISQEAFRGQEYTFLLVVLTSLLMVVLMIIKKEKSQNMIPFLVIFSMIVSVVPLAGHHHLPVKLEVHRLEELLTEEGILLEDEISPTGNLSEDLKADITESIDYLVYSKDVDLPSWLKRDLKEEDQFRETFGFERTLSKRAVIDDDVYLHLQASGHEIKDFDYAVYLEHSQSSFEGKNGWYHVQWLNDRQGIKIYLEDKLILEDYLEDYYRQLELGGKDRSKVENLSYKIVSEQIEILVVFQYVSYSTRENANYAEVKVVYLKEK